MASGDSDEQPNVTAADQQLINKFARLHQNFAQIREEMASLMTDLANINEAVDEIMLLGDDDGQAIPYKIGQTFVHFDSDSINERLEKDKEQVETDVDEMKDKSKNLEEQMEKLKTNLYEKFGDHINLETDKE
ncbi:unnamed protein product, partial [Mesorhabditis belari]|uniref:Prefoldin subunit 4 n=1 Tax=Mesorhabditis belari TaxID=2138241 RepID=A0AAF3FRT1_9BILA